jgi:hypothetical protein
MGPMFRRDAARESQRPIAAAGPLRPAAVLFEVTARSPSIERTELSAAAAAIIIPIPRAREIVVSRSRDRAITRRAERRRRCLDNRFINSDEIDKIDRSRGLPDYLG